MILILQHNQNQGLGYLAEFLEARAVDYHVLRVDEHADLPDDVDGFAGLIFLGSSHSVNDGYTWIEDEVALIRKAAQADLPVLGICFGSQLISKALGGEVTKARMMQAGWFDVTVTEQARSIFDASLPDTIEVFEWHDDEFILPAGATPLFYGNCTENQGFLHRKCLAIQFHPEFTRSKIQCCLSNHDGLENHPSQCVQNREEMLAYLDERMRRMHALADTVFPSGLTRMSSNTHAKMKPSHGCCARYHARCFMLN